jgi:hypothetical protein
VSQTFAVTSNGTLAARRRGLPKSTGAVPLVSCFDKELSRFDKGAELPWQSPRRILEFMLVKQPQGFTTALQCRRIAGMNRTQKQFSLNCVASKSNFLSVQNKQGD